MRFHVALYKSVAGFFYYSSHSAKLRIPFHMACKEGQLYVVEMMVTNSRLLASIWMLTIWFSVLFSSFQVPKLRGNVPISSAQKNFRSLLFFISEVQNFCVLTLTVSPSNRGPTSQHQFSHQNPLKLCFLSGKAFLLASLPFHQIIDLSCFHTCWE